MKITFTVLWLLFILNAISQTTYFVNDNATGANNGTSWTDAFTKLQDALTAAESGDQIWVAAGIYYPDEGSGLTNNDRSHSFHLKNGVAIYGGFAGTESLLSERNVTANVSTLSGEIQQDNENTNNAYHVVQSSSVENTAVLDGLSIIGGNANGDNFPNNIGGGMLNNDASLPTLTNCSFSANMADIYGGGIYNDDSYPILTNCCFSGNTAGSSGGGIFNNFSSPTLTNCSFSGNTASSSGGGMYNDNSSSPILTNCSFTGNTAGGGGGIYNILTSAPTLTNCSFSGNTADMGGGMYNAFGSRSAPTLTNCSFTGNTANLEGGGIYNLEVNSPPLSLTNCSFSGNKAGGSGGGMYNDYSSPSLNNCIFTGNKASSNGGGMYNANSSYPSLINCSFSGNTASDGGGLYNIISSPTLTNCSFSGNSASQGGGMYTNGSSPILTNCSFSGNNGEGIFNEESNTTLINCSFTGNTGGGMTNYDINPPHYNPTLTNCSFTGNTAGFGGGGGMINYGGSPILTNCSFSENTAYLGGGMFNNDGSPILTNCSFSRNIAVEGGGIYNVFSSPILTNCIIWANTGDQIINIEGSSPVVTYSIVQGGFPGTGNLDQDPLFVDAANGDLHLQEGSPAIDAGLNSANTTSVDLDGNPRIVNGIIDMGAYEFQSTTAPLIITSVTASPASLWPPNHKMKEVHVTVVTTGGSGSTSCQITSVTSNEPQSGNGKGDLSPDWQIIGPDKVLLRAERNGNGNGRIYTITVTCTDAAGSSASGSVSATVPHDQGHKEPPAIVESEDNTHGEFGIAGGSLRVVPNPFNTHAKISFSVPQSGYTTLELIDQRGAVVERLYAAQADAGQVYTLQYNSKQLKSGVYMLRLISGKYVQTYKLVFTQ